MGLQRVGRDLATEQQQSMMLSIFLCACCLFVYLLWRNVFQGFFFFNNFKIRLSFFVEMKVFFIYSDINPLSIYALQITELITFHGFPFYSIVFFVADKFLDLI